MAVTIAQMTKRELKEMIGTVVEQKLLEFLGDPDEGLPVRESVRNRLMRQRQAVVKGLRGQPLEKIETPTVRPAGSGGWTGGFPPRRSWPRCEPAIRPCRTWWGPPRGD